jgi:hypothetical protein
MRAERALPSVSGAELGTAEAFMAIRVPHLPRPGSVLATTALACVLCAAPASATLAQQPDPTPLWKAYPLKPDESAGAKPARRPIGAPLPAQTTPRARPAESPGTSGAPLAVAVVSYLALGFLAVVGVGAAARLVARRRRRLVTCEISLAPGEDGDAFLAVQLDGEEARVVARSRRFERRSPQPPYDDAASHEAYEQLLRGLYAEGWQPYDRGRQWWEMRLRHAATTETPTPARHG